MEFAFDLTKSEANKAKHGLDFVQAQALWNGFGVTGPLTFRGEDRWLRVGILQSHHWLAVFVKRNGRVRLISVRRARKDEVKLHDDAERREHDHQS